jgi:hypothetical protein
MSNTNKATIANQVGDRTDKKSSLEVVKTDVKPEKPVKVETAAQRIEMNEHLALIGKRFKFLTEKRKDVQQFLSAHDGTSSAKLIVTNATGLSLEIANPDVVADLLRNSERKLDSMIEATELEILSFNI